MVAIEMPGLGETFYNHLLAFTLQSASTKIIVPILQILEGRGGGIYNLSGS